MQIKPSAAIRQNYGEVSRLCKTTMEPVYLTVNGEGDLAVMSIEAFEKREKMLNLREALLRVEEERLAGRKEKSPEELDAYLKSALLEGKNRGTV